MVFIHLEDIIATPVPIINFKHNAYIFNNLDKIWKNRSESNTFQLEIVLFKLYYILNMK
jgi:hypothetical protein